MAYTFLLLAALIIIAQVEGQDYCKICKDHTMCLYKGTSSTCKKELKRGVSDAEKTIILQEHNKYRLKIAKGEEKGGKPGPQPSAANMRVLVWDNEIAKTADMWVRQCMFAHDKCRNTNGNYVGQNLYQSSTSETSCKTNWASAVNAWYSEVVAQSKYDNKPFKFNHATGHYTQVAWATTTKVGCGFMCYQKDGWTNMYYACNYLPGGNVIGTEMYKDGPACSACPGNCNAQYKGLCNK